MLTQVLWHISARLSSWQVGHDGEELSVGLEAECFLKARVREVCRSGVHDPKDGRSSSSLLRQEHKCSHGPYRSVIIASSRGDVSISRAYTRNKVFVVLWYVPLEPVEEKSSPANV